jgi:hypothetical protein
MDALCHGALWQKGCADFCCCATSRPRDVLMQGACLRTVFVTIMFAADDPLLTPPGRPSAIAAVLQSRLLE